MKWPEGGRTLRRHLIAGLIVIAPAGVTAFVLFYIFQWLDGILGRFLYAALGRSIPGLGLLALLVLLLVVGWVAERAVGARALSFWHAWLERIPVARRVYNASNRIVRTMFTGSRGAFRDVVLLEYPADGRWSIGFLAGDAPTVVQKQTGRAVTVFVPTTPNPTSGWLVILPAERVIRLPMTLEEAFTYILSAGVVTPAEEDAAIPPSADGVVPVPPDVPAGDGGEDGA